MAWSSSAVATVESTAYAADRPLLIGTALGDGLRPIWSSDSGLYSDTDRSHASGPAHFAVDRAALRQTYPSTAATDEWFFVLGEFATAQEFDCFAFFNANFHTLGGITVTLQRADNSAFSTNLTTVVSIIEPTTPRYLALHDRITGTGHLRIRLSSASPFVPYVGEFWIGRRRQLRGHLQTGRDADRVTSRHAEAHSSIASQIRQPLSMGGRALDVSIRMNGRESTLDDYTSVYNWWQEIDYGTKPFVYCRQPYTQHDEVLIVTTDADVLDVPRLSGPYHRSLDQAWREMPPFLGAE